MTPPAPKFKSLVPADPAEYVGLGQPTELLIRASAFLREGAPFNPSEQGTTVRTGAGGSGAAATIADVLDAALTYAARPDWRYFPLSEAAVAIAVSVLQELDPRHLA